MSLDALEQNILLQPRPRSFQDRQHWHPQEKWLCLGYPAKASAAPHMLLEALGAAIFSQDQSAGDVQ